MPRKNSKNSKKNSKNNSRNIKTNNCKEFKDISLQKMDKRIKDEKNCVYNRCKTCLKLKKGNYFHLNLDSLKNEGWRYLDSSPCKSSDGNTHEYVNFRPQFREMGMNTYEVKNGWPSGSKLVYKKYGLKNC